MESESSLIKWYDRWLSVCEKICALDSLWCMDGCMVPADNWEWMFATWVWVQWWPSISGPRGSCHRCHPPVSAHCRGRHVATPGQPSPSTVFMCYHQSQYFQNKPRKLFLILHTHTQTPTRIIIQPPLILSEQTLPSHQQHFTHSLRLTYSLNQYDSISIYKRRSGQWQCDWSWLSDWYSVSHLIVRT